MSEVEDGYLITLIFFWYVCVYTVHIYIYNIIYIYSTYIYIQYIYIYIYTLYIYCTVYIIQLYMYIYTYLYYIPSSIPCNGRARHSALQVKHGEKVGNPQCSIFVIDKSRQRMASVGWKSKVLRWFPAILVEWSLRNISVNYQSLAVMSLDSL